MPQESNCWKPSIALYATTQPVTANVNAAKAEKRTGMVYAETKAGTRANDYEQGVISRTHTQRV